MIFNYGASDRRTRLVHNWAQFLLRTLSILLGNAFFALGIASFLHADLGMNTWAVLDVGIVEHTCLTLGQSTQLTGLAALLLGWGLGFPPGFATVISVYSMGWFVDAVLILGLVPQSADIAVRCALLMAGIALFGAGTYFYVNPRMGAGPRDSLMMGLIRRLGRPVSHVRTGLELSVLAVGYLLGGPVGVGTVVSAMLVGYAVDLAFRLGKYDRDAEHLDLHSILLYLRGRKTM
ncbi:MAG: membrane protein [Candidatus Bathyarchaeota archaeon]|nr:MAG: membrane protein [Candidatus Bathyarchaeota archaeon]